LLYPTAHFIISKIAQLELGVAFFLPYMNLPLKSLYKRFAKHFANSVFRNFMQEGRDKIEDYVRDVLINT